MEKEKKMKIKPTKSYKERAGGCRNKQFYLEAMF